MRRLTLTINCQKRTESNVLKLPWRNVKLKDVFDYYPQSEVSNSYRLLKAIELKHIEKFHIDVFVKEMPISNLLTKMNNLMELTIEDLDVHMYGIIKLPKLKLLKLSYKSLSLIAVLKCHELNSLVLRSWQDEWPTFANTFEQFVDNCTKLKQLSFTGLPSLPVLSSNIKLQMLELRGFRIDLNGIDLFESQKSSLKSLHLDVDYLEDEVSEFIYKEMNLHTLIDKRMVRGGFRDDLRIVSVKHLEMNVEREILSFIQNLFPHLDYLDTLKLNLDKTIEFEVLEMVSQLPKLTTLEIIDWFFDGEIEDNLIFPELKKLSLPSRRIIKGFYRCPKLKSLKLRAVSNQTDLTEIMSNCPVLEELDLGALNNFTEEMLAALNIAGLSIKIKCQVTNSDYFEKVTHSANNIMVELRFFNPYEDDNNK